MDTLFRFRQTGLCRILFLLIVSVTVFPAVSPISAAPAGITITVQGDQSYMPGEELLFSGFNYETGSTYLFINGPNLPVEGAKPSSPYTGVVTGDEGSFAVVPVAVNGEWEYRLYTGPLGIGSGVYTVFAVTGPANRNNLTSRNYNTTTFILTNPIILAEIHPSVVLKGETFTVSGTVKDYYPHDLRVWIIGKNFLYLATTPVQSYKTYSHTVDKEITEILPEGQNYLIIQHPLVHGYNVVMEGDHVYWTEKPDTKTQLFRINGPGCLQGRDAAEALVHAFGMTDHGDTYTEIPLAVNKTHITAYGLVETPVPADGTVQALLPTAMPECTQPVPEPTQAAACTGTLFTALALVAGIAAMGWYSK
ncbi:MAG: hypothetical protein GX651_01775 [Methanomicrobiales archaeon]|nr:hypothetical protein [Methanomicrobiales archaeon]